jgi:hypothetical protein
MIAGVELQQMHEQIYNRDAYFRPQQTLLFLFGNKFGKTHLVVAHG